MGVRRLRLVNVPILLALAWLPLATPATAHNGAVALAATVDRIQIDGVLTDWPETVRESPITHAEFGDAPTDAADLSGWLRVAFEAEVGHLCLAMRVIDQSHVADPLAPNNWQSQDGCEVYLDLNHGADRSTGRQYVLYAGQVPRHSGSGVEVARQVTPDGYCYEWSIDIADWLAAQAQPALPRSLGLDVSLEDRDADGSFSWVSWGPGTGKLESVDRRGDVLLVAGGQPLGAIHGTVAWSQGAPWSGAAVVVESRALPALWTQVRTDARGSYQAELPAGPCRVRIQRDTAELELVAGSDTDYSVRVPPPQGYQGELGPGRGTPVGAGVWRDGWQTFSMQDGLPDDAVTALYQDPDGVLWIGSGINNLTLFDGEAFTTWTGRDGLPAGSIRALTGDASGNVWYGTERGDLVRLSRGRITVLSAQDGLPGSAINALLAAPDGTLWIGTENGLVKYDGSSLRTLTVTDGLSGNGVTRLALGPEGAVWVGTRAGLTCYDGTVCRRYSVADGLASNEVTALFVDSSGTAWVGSPGGRISRWAGTRFVTAGPEAEPGAVRISCLLDDRRGQRWVGTAGEGLVLDDGPSRRRFGDSVGLTGVNINCLLVDREGTLWVGTGDGGLSRCQTARMQSWASGAELPEERVTRLMRTRDGALWIATAGSGLVRWRGTERRAFTVADGLSDATVWALLEDRDGTVWAGTQGGVCRLLGDRFVRLPLPQAMAANTWDLLQDRSGAVWIAAQGGLARYTAGRCDLFGVADGLVYSDVRCLLEDRQGGVWMGTIFGLSCYREGRFTSLTTTEGLLHNDVRDLLESVDGDLWVATQAGVCRYDGHRFTALTVEDGLASNNVWALMQDRHGTIWAGSYGGVSRYDGEVVQALLPRDGLAPRAVHALLEDPDGGVWIGGRGGLTRYVSADVPPSMNLTEVVTDRRLGPRTEIRLPSTQGLLSFEYRAVSLNTRPGGMLYRYRFGDAGAPWRTTHRRQLEFADVPIGSHTLEVQGINGDLDRSQGIARVQVTVHPPYGQLLLWAVSGLSLVGLVAAGTALGRRNRQVRRQQARFGNLLELAPDGVVVIAADGRITLVNAQVERIFGYGRDELLGQPIERVIPDRFEAVHVRHRTGFLQAARTRPPDSGLVVVGRRKNGEEFPAEISLSSLVAHGEMLAFANVRDITERLRIQRELELARDAADTANQAKSAFLANMSHEIRTPMNGIVGMVDLLRRTLLTPHQRSCLDIVDHSAESLLELISDVLDLSKIEAGSMRLESTRFVLWDTLDGVAKLMAPRAHGKGLELTCRVLPEVPRELCGDPARLRQVLVNLIGNAIKFTLTGEVAVTIGCLAATADRAQLRVAVRDTGTGIEPARQQVIFDAFAQADSSTTRQYGGTGLGLAICRQLVGLMQGQIGVISEVDAGSTFWFTAWFAVPPASGDAEVAPPWRGLGPVRILAVDDHATQREVLVEMLGQWGFGVEAVGSADEALAALSQARAAGVPHDLLLLDGAMPELPAPELHERLRSQGEFAGPVVFMLPATADQEAIDQLEARGVRQYLRKPVTPSDLLEGLVAALSGDASAPAPQPGSAAMATTLRRILLADDNATNRYVATSMLEEAGHRVVGVANGAEALACWAEGEFDLVLMDVQMPELDGYETTRAIRERERATGGHIPIIGLTANAMKGAREACLAAGMDDYVPKPVRWEGLRTAIERAIPEPAAGATGATAPDVALALAELGLAPLVDSAPVSVPDIDPELWARLAEDVAESEANQVLETSVLTDLAQMAARGAISVHRMVALFDADVETLIPELRARLADGKSAELRRQAHGLKGSARDVGAVRLAGLCQQLEDCARANEWEPAAGLVAQIDQAAHEAREALREHLGNRSDTAPE
jgi:PAS domain S-box-containing protein